ncbi:MAG: SIMPL domain-containing protein [Candidatus Pacebacteria bacterium]|nr:SIMPL domain-containing protein [Candidatus Paceibacterota bacterium]
MENKKVHPLVMLGIILGGSFVVAVAIGMVTLFRLRSLSDVVAVTGSAKIEVTADQAKWTTQVTRSTRESTLRSGYEQIANDATKARAFLLAQGIDESELAVTPISMNEIYQQNQSAEKLYNLSQTFTVQSQDVAKVTKASNNLSPIINQGVIFSSLALEYYYSKLPEARIQLLSAAIDDAKARATELAKNSGRSVGSLKSATSGVVQVQSRNSTDVSDYGSYDTSQIEKQITVTVKATFSLR